MPHPEIAFDSLGTPLALGQLVRIGNYQEDVEGVDHLGDDETMQGMIGQVHTIISMKYDPDDDLDWVVTLSGDPSYMWYARWVEALIPEATGLAALIKRYKETNHV